MKTENTEKNAKLVYDLISLGMAGGVLHIGAHPDDEDIGLLAYLSCKYGVSATYWSANRGEGGQNRIGSYRDEALGVYRTWESLAAREEDGSNCLFGPFYDFGYSKNAEETFSKWGRESIVKEIVRAIRLVQPHIIVARWNGTPSDFHGHHQAVGKATYEAFETAGDPSRFPELNAQGLPPWQPLKFYHSTDNSGGDLMAGGTVNLFGNPNLYLENQGALGINTGEFDPISGRTYQERAWIAYNRHQTQAIGMAPAPGPFYYYFFLYKSLVKVPDRETTLLDGIDPTLTGLADQPGNGSPRFRKSLQRIKLEAEKALEQFRANDPNRASQSILNGLTLLRELKRHLKNLDFDDSITQAIDLYLSRKIRDFERVAGKCLGLEVEALNEVSRITPGHKVKMRANLWNNRDVKIKKVEFNLHTPEDWKIQATHQKAYDEQHLIDLTQQSNVPISSHFDIIIGDTAELSCPYWLVKPREAYEYHWPSGEPSSRPFAPPQASIECHIDLGSHQLTLMETVVGRETFPGGFRELPVAVIPPISLQPRAIQEFRQVQNKAQQLEVQVVALNNAREKVQGTLELVVPEGWNVNPGKMNIALEQPRESRNLSYEVTIPPNCPAGRYKLQHTFQCGEREYKVVVDPIRMGPPGISSPPDESNCIKEEFILKPSEVVIHLIDVKFVKGLRYAYIQGTEEDLLKTLRSFGLDFYLISDEEMGHVDLSVFDAVVVGPNAYLIRDELRKYASRFLEYIKNGGTLIVQFQGYGYQGNGYAPYPFSYNQPHDRVTHEDAPVNILTPNQLVLNVPNPISTKDFSGWVRERGLYFFGQWDNRYQTILSCSDPGEDPKEGGLIECQYGKGTYLYAGYSFFGQLPAGVPGAFRLFANILALPEARILERIKFLSKIPLFSLLTEEHLESIARIMYEQWVDKDEYVCHQGEEGDEMYVVYRGEVEVIRESGGQKQTVYVAKEGDCIGEMAILGNIPRTATLCPRGKVELLVIKGASFIDLLRTHPDMSIQVIKLLLNRLTNQS